MNLFSRRWIINMDSTVCNIHISKKFYFKKNAEKWILVNWNKSCYSRLERITKNC